MAKKSPVGEKESEVTASGTANQEIARPVGMSQVRTDASMLEEINHRPSADQVMSVIRLVWPLKIRTFRCVSFVFGQKTGGKREKACE